jgi:hypothetical protein
MRPSPIRVVDLTSAYFQTLQPRVKAPPSVWSSHEFVLYLV